MTGDQGERVTEQDVDWAEVERRGRAREPLFLLPLAALVIGWAGASEKLVFATGRTKWIVAGAYVLLFAVQVVAQRMHRGFRARAGEGHRVLYALREHVDPGPGLRERADRQAASMVGIVWFRWWLLFLMPVGILLGAPWTERPFVVAASALLLIAGVVAWALFTRRMFADSRRWLADPPGPDRQMPELPRWRRWLSGWGFLWTLLGVLAVTIGVSVVVVVAR